MRTEDRTLTVAAPGCVRTRASPPAEFDHDDVLQVSGTVVQVHRDTSRADRIEML